MTATHPGTGTIPANPTVSATHSGVVPTPSSPADGGSDSLGFQVVLANFSGPFDLLLSLIARRQLDITEIALIEVTDEFLAYVATLESDVEALEQSTSFMVVAATLLDLKTAQLLPAGVADPEEELALLEERDLLFARLLQYKAFREAAALLRTRMAEQSLRQPRNAGPELAHTQLLPQLEWTLSPEDLAALATEVFSREIRLEPDTVDVDHLHSAQVSVSEQITLMSNRLALAGTLSFAQLIADADTVMVVVARFMGVLEMYRDRSVTLVQPVPLGEITVHWEHTQHPEHEGPAGTREASATAVDAELTTGHEVSRHE